MMGGPPGAGPGVNDLVVPHATLKVSNIPSFVTQSDFSRLMTQLEGCVDARLLGRCARVLGVACFRAADRRRVKMMAGLHMFGRHWHHGRAT